MDDEAVEVFRKRLAEIGIPLKVLTGHVDIDGAPNPKLRIPILSRASQTDRILAAIASFVGVAYVVAAAAMELPPESPTDLVLLLASVVAALALGALGIASVFAFVVHWKHPQCGIGHVPLGYCRDCKVDALRAGINDLETYIYSRNVFGWPPEGSRESSAGAARAPRELAREGTAATDATTGRRATKGGSGAVSAPRARNGAFGGCLSQMYEKKDSKPLTQPEVEFYAVLSKWAAGKGLLVFPKVSLHEYIAVADKWKNRSADKDESPFWRIQGKNVDFLVVQSDTFDIRCAIEYDDLLHNHLDPSTDEELKTVRNDCLKALALKAAHIPLIRLPYPKGAGKYTAGDVEREVRKQTVSQRRRKGDDRYPVCAHGEIRYKTWDDLHNTYWELCGRL